jgi:hypothetical protein
MTITRTSTSPLPLPSESQRASSSSCYTSNGHTVEDAPPKSHGTVFEQLSYSREEHNMGLESAAPLSSRHHNLDRQGVASGLGFCPVARRRPGDFTL